MHKKLLESAAHALSHVLKFEYPADAVLGRYFREHEALGQHDRALIAEAVFGVLRRKRVLEHLTRQASPRRLLLAWLVRFDGVSVREIASVVTPQESAWLIEVKAASLDGLPPAVLAELPDWVYERLAGEFGHAEALTLGRALQEPAPLDLRVNLVRADRESALSRLGQSGIAAAPTPYSPVGIRVEGKPAINRLPLFLEGAIEV